MASGPAIQDAFNHSAAREHQRQLQQGLGKPIISLEQQGERFVAVGSRLYRSTRWKTFHDFLLYYIRDVLAGDWANAELAKPTAKRHPLMTWYHDVTLYLNARIKERGKVHGTDMTGMLAAYLGLAYNLYLVAHHQKLHESLVRRLKHRDQFYGAYYEAFVIGALLRAGFDIELEDESDSTVSHCELTATFRPTGEKFSVEAKMRGANKQSVDVGNQLYNALKKQAKHSRIVFIEVNAAGDGTLGGQKKILHDVLASLRSREAKLTIDGIPAPAAYIIATNNPHGAVDCAHEASAMAEGFKIPDFRMEAIYGSLQEAVAAREKHAAVTALLTSLAEHRQIPVTFDGELPEFSFGAARNRLLLGQRYTLESEQGSVTGVLESADINVSEKRVSGIIRQDDGSRTIVQIPVSDAEIEAYQAAPQTFFGVLQPKRTLKTPLEAYDWIYESYRHNTKEHFLKLLAGAPDLESLSQLTQPELAKIYAERVAYSIMEQTGLGQTKPPGS